MTRPPMQCAHPDCGRDAYDTVELGLATDKGWWEVVAEFALCPEHDALIAVIGDEVMPLHLPTFRITVSGRQV